MYLKFANFTSINLFNFMRKIAIYIVLLIPVLTFCQADIEKEVFRDPKSLFKAYVVAGLNFSQIDGDNSAGYNTIGANGGVGVFVNYTDKFSNSLEITYSMRGARRNLFRPQNTTGTFNYQADYIDIPLLSTTDLHAQMAVDFILAP